jgi:hypothetical protein
MGAHGECRRVAGGGGAPDTQIVFTDCVPETVPSNSPGCAFEIGVVTSGISGQFYSGPGGGDRVRHATRSDQKRYGFKTCTRAAGYLHCAWVR